MLPVEVGHYHLSDIPLLSVNWTTIAFYVGGILGRLKKG
jgi:hypothetical protein